MPRLLAIPACHLVLAIGVDGKPEQQNVVVEDGGGFGVLAAHQIVGELDGVLRGRDLGGMQSAIDVDDHFAVVGEFVRLGVGEALDQGEAAGGVLILIEAGEIFARRR